MRQLRASSEGGNKEAPMYHNGRTRDNADDLLSNYREIMSSMTEEEGSSTGAAGGSNEQEDVFLGEDSRTVLVSINGKALLNPVEVDSDNCETLQPTPVNPRFYYDEGFNSSGKYDYGLRTLSNFSPESIKNNTRVDLKSKGFSNARQKCSLRPRPNKVLLLRMAHKNNLGNKKHSKTISPTRHEIYGAKILNKMPHKPFSTRLGREKIRDFMINKESKINTIKKKNSEAFFVSIDENRLISVNENSQNRRIVKTIDCLNDTMRNTKIS